MKKNLYVYIDQPTSLFQVKIIINLNSKLKNYNIKFISTEKINYTKGDIKRYFKFTPKEEIIKNKLVFSSFKKFEIFLKNLKPEDIILVLGRETTENRHNSYDLHLFKKYNIKTIFLSKEPWIQFNFRKSIFVGFLRLLHKLFKEIKFLFENKKKQFMPHILIGSGVKSKKEFQKNPGALKYFDLPSMWIDFKKNYKKKNIITYVDESLFYARDLQLNNNKTNKSSNISKFLNDLKNFFDKLEKSTDLKVIIACSKKHKKYDNKIFGSRKIFYGKTLELISKSTLVLGHFSEALNQAIYNTVPVICLKHKTFPFLRNLMIESKSIKLFNKNSIFIEDYITNKKKLDLSIDKKYYKNIFHNYFISPNLKYENFSDKLKYEIEKIKLFDNQVRLKKIN